MEIKLLLAALAHLSSIVVAWGADECPALAPRESAPTSVDDLRPDDISVMMAMGDSITAGFAVRYERGFSFPKENRGSVFSIGGDPDVTTLPNLFKIFNPAIIGPSVGNHSVRTCSPSFCLPDRLLYVPSKDILNGAVSSASFLTLEKEFSYIMRQIANLGIDVHRTWKFITILIGGNDVCKRACTNPDLADEFESGLLQLVQMLEQHLPMTIAALVSLPDINQLYDLTRNSDKCKTVQILTKRECPCLFRDDEAREALKETTLEFNRRIERVASMFKNSTTFAATTIPVLSGVKLEDDSWLSPIDCFHINLEAHETAAVSMWNSLFVKSEYRSVAANVSEPVYCPSPDDRIRL